MAFGAVAGVVQIALLARLLGPSGLGVLGLLAAVTVVFGGVFRSNSAETVVTFLNRALAGDRASAGVVVGTCYLTDLGSSLLALAALLVFLPFGGAVGIDAPHRWLVGLYGCTLLGTATYWVSSSLLRVANRFHWAFYQSTASAAVKTLAIAALAWRHAPLSGVVWVTVALACADGVAMFALARRALRRIGVATDFSRAFRSLGRDFWRFALLGHGRGVLKTTTRYLDMLVIGALLPTQQVGLYRAARQMADQLQLPAQALVSSLYPEYSRLWFTHQHARLRRLVAWSSAGLAGVGVLAVAGVWLAGGLLIRLLLGSAFLGAREALVVLVLASVLNLAMTPVYSVPTAAGRGGAPLRAALAATVVQFALMYFLVPAHGIVGAAWSNVAFYLAWTLVLIPSVMALLRHGGAPMPAAAPPAGVPST